VLQDLFVQQADCASGPVFTGGCVPQDLFVQQADCASGPVCKAG
jgi:hypothetical protein